MFETIIRDLLWVVIMGGWAFLIATGLEADKPLSGGIPGHVVASDEPQTTAAAFFDRLGEIAGWLVFGLTITALPLVLWWIFVVHTG